MDKTTVVLLVVLILVVLFFGFSNLGASAQNVRGVAGGVGSYQAQANQYYGGGCVR